MVTFNCEVCNDTVIKKKLDQHKGQCWGATFTCIDCNTTFQGTDYRAHTSCITEAQKYQGKLYRPEKPKGGRNQNPRNGGGKSNGYTPGTSTNSIAVTPRVFGQNKDTPAEDGEATPSTPASTTTTTTPPVLAATPTGSRLKKDEERVFDKNVPLTVTPKKAAPEPVKESPKVKDVVVAKDADAASEKKEKKDKKESKSDKKEKKDKEKKDKKAEKEEKKEKKKDKEEVKSEKKDKKDKEEAKSEKKDKKDKKRKRDDSDDETPATPPKKDKADAAIPPTLVKAFEAVKEDGKKNSLKDFIKAISSDKKTKKEILSGFTVSKRKVGDKEEIVLTPVA
ncbi:hypothetical protein BJ508DRAFT_412372 [Ascobolus immersus RN42]|uniref:Zinc finger C2H2 LYAR-type domain-containing protein n=1 Tax=Ascobolus immersus RN42 TaxID=1160509 RepID=A0A3N4IJR8_ASCIM|nr:hypothetical protein BJ508DRAFT_412372 [Ascobolus immersus RN42]